MALKLITFLTFLSTSLSFVNAQQDIEGKTYKALIGETCKAMTDGGCMLYTYRILTFKQDSVIVSYQVAVNCSEKERENNYIHMYDNLCKVYKWSIAGNIITVEGFDDYGRLTVFNNKLICEDKEESRHIEFDEDIK